MASGATDVRGPAAAVQVGDEPPQTENEAFTLVTSWLEAHLIQGVARQQVFERSHFGRWHPPTVAERADGLPRLTVHEVDLQRRFEAARQRFQAHHGTEALTRAPQQRLRDTLSLLGTVEDNLVTAEAKDETKFPDTEQGVGLLRCLCLYCLRPVEECRVWDDGGPVRHLWDEEGSVRGGQFRPSCERNGPVFVHGPRPPTCSICNGDNCMTWIEPTLGGRRGGYWRQACSSDEAESADENEDGSWRAPRRCRTCGSRRADQSGRMSGRLSLSRDVYCRVCHNRRLGLGFIGDPRPWDEERDWDRWENRARQRRARRPRAQGRR